MDIVMMGASKAGRTSIAKVIFQKMVSKQTQLLGETTKVESYDFRIQKLEFKLYDFPARYDMNEPPPNEQMILKNAEALIFVLNPQADTSKALDDFQNVYHYLRKRNRGRCSIFLFTNKADIELSQQEARNEYQLKTKKRINDDGIDVKEIDFHFTSIFDYSVFEGFSRVMQKMVACAPQLNKGLAHFACTSKIEKVYLFDLITKLYIATNDEKVVEPVKYEVCSELLDIFIDISFLYGNDKQSSMVGEDASNKIDQNRATVKLNLDDSN